jgi:Na+/melibiose symporter-like transporter
MDFIDFPQNALPDEISTIMLNKLAILAGPFSMILFLCTILITIKYPLNAMKHAKIRATIDDKNDE